MNPLLALLLMFVSGALVAIQSPINTALSKNIGRFPAVLVSFSTGTLLVALVTLFLRSGNLAAVVRVPAWQLLGGALGTAFVASFVVAVPVIGVSRAVLAGLLGQILTAVVVDQLGLFGTDPRPATPTRMFGIALMGVGLFLANRG